MNEKRFHVLEIIKRRNKYNKGKMILCICIFFVLVLLLASTLCNPGEGKHKRNILPPYGPAFTAS